MKALPYIAVLLGVLACSSGGEKRLNVVSASSEPVESAAFTPMQFRDRETGSRWNLCGEAVEGELAGQTLRQLPAYSAYWFAWSSFWRNTAVWNLKNGDGSLRDDAFVELPTSEFVSDLPQDAIPPPAGFGRAEFINPSEAFF